MRERRVRVCARSVCDDDDAQNGEKSRRGVKGMFCKSSARRSFVSSSSFRDMCFREENDDARARERTRDATLSAL